MSRFAPLVLSCLLVGAAANAPAQEPSRATHNEITHLFEHLEQSGCEFYRNGSWHDSKKASEHLRKKYVYLLAKELVPSTEAFIERAATKSSLSGKPYRVRCADRIEVQGSAWFDRELARWRNRPTR